MKVMPIEEYRKTVLKVPQSEAARRCKIAQGSYSKIARGHLPKAWRIEDIAKGLGMKEKYFVACVKMSRELNEMRIPLYETMPLLALSQGDGQGQVDQMPTRSGEVREA